MKEFKLITALITPLIKENKIDYIALKKIIDYQLLNNVDTFVIFGTTGEGSLISLKEKKKTIIKLLQEYNIHLIVGISNISTYDSCKEIKYFSSLNIDGFLVLTPTYIKTNQLGLYNHYSKISKYTSKDIYLYDIKARTGQDLDLETISNLQKIKNIKGIKCASGEDKLKNVIKLKTRFKIFLGDDLLLLNGLENKIDGLISVCSNAYCKTINKIISLYQDNKINESKELFNKYQNYFPLMFNEPNPIPIKYLMHKLNYSTIFYSRPLYYPSKELKKLIQERYIEEI